jgi:hypothetical protein
MIITLKFILIMNHSCHNCGIIIAGKSKNAKIIDKKCFELIENNH